MQRVRRLRNKTREMKAKQSGGYLGELTPSPSCGMYGTLYLKTKTLHLN